MAGNPKFRFLYVIWAFAECLLFGGLLYGWGSLVFILIEDGVYSEICENQTEAGNRLIASNISGTNQPSTVALVTYNIIDNSSQSTEAPEGEEGGRPNANCPDRDKRLTLVFTIGSMLFCVGCAAMGQINFKFGTRITRLCAFACFTVGALLSGFTTHEHPWLIFPGLSLLGIGGIPLLMTNIQFSGLFSKGSSTVVSMLSGSFDASSGVMLIVKLVYENGVALRWSMIVITCLHALTLVNTFLFLPRGFIAKKTTEPVKEDATGNEVAVELISKTNPRVENGGNEMEKIPPEVGVEEGKQLPSIQSCVLSPVYFLHVIWLSVLQLRFYYFLGSLNTWLNTLFSTKEEVSYYTNVCLYAMMCGLVTSPVAGIIYDTLKRFFVNSRSKLHRDLMPAVIPLALTSLLGIILSVFVMANNQSILYPAFIFNTIFRSFIYSMGAAYIGALFPSDYFGLLYGLMIILSGIFSLAQYGLFSWAEASGFTAVNGFLIAFMGTSLVHPLYQWYCCRRAESEVVLEEQ